MNEGYKYDERELWELFKCICVAVQNVHSSKYVHRDIKPANFLLDDTEKPILIDFGSVIASPTFIENRSMALYHQDLASIHSTMPYRAPELFDVKSESTLDEKVDIWSLGCTLYALAYSHSPFEDPKQTAQGASISMAVQSRSFTYPKSDNYSQDLKSLINSCLNLNPSERPSIENLLQNVNLILQ